MHAGIPVLIEEPENTVVKAGENGMLICSATSIPAPIITWYRLTNDNATMEVLPGSFSNILIDDTTLTVNNIEYYQDEGYYVCQASNYLQTISAVSFLKVYGKHS